MPRGGVTLGVTLVIGLLACGRSGGQKSARAASEQDAATAGLRGTPLAKPLERPDFTLTDTRGRSFDFRKRTAGGLTLLYFGYTNCPDVCPVHMANIAAVLSAMPPKVVRVTQVVFVTVDPRRDTATRLRAWLDGFDRDFIGLRGSIVEVRAIEAKLGLPPTQVDSSARSDAPASGGVGHAAQVIAFTPDDLAHVVYPFGTRQQDWAHDLPLLLARFRNRSAGP